MHYDCAEVGTSPAASAWGSGRAATTHVLAAPRKLAHRPLLDQAVVAPMIPSIAIIGQRRRRAWGRGGSCWRAALARSPAAEGLLAFGPALLPVREAPLQSYGHGVVT